MHRKIGHRLFRWGVVALLLALLAGVGVVMYGRIMAPKVTVTEVVDGPVVQAFYATGTLSAEREYPIHSNIEGIVTQVLVDKGYPVKAGQKLAFVRAEDYQMKYAQAEADFKLKESLAREDTSPVLRQFDKETQAAGEQLEIARRDLKRVQDLLGHTATQSDFDRASERVETFWREVESLKAGRDTRKLELARDLEVAKRALDITQWNIDQQNIISPIDGVVLDWPASVGSRTKINERLMLVADVRPEKLVMRAAVDEEDKTRLFIGQKVRLTLYAYAGRSLSGSVKKIYPKADPDRRTFEVDVAIEPSDPGFAAGMTGELAFIVDQREKAAVVPSQAVQGGGIWVVRQGQLAKVNAKIGLRGMERSEVLPGSLIAGEQVVVSPADGLHEGQRVRTEYMDPAAAAGLNKPAEEKALRSFQ